MADVECGAGDNGPSVRRAALMSGGQEQELAPPPPVTVGMLSIPLAQLVLIVGILRLTVPGQTMPQALAVSDLMELALAGEDIGNVHEAKRWVHHHAAGRLQAEGERLIAAGLAVPMEQPGGPGFAIHQENAFTVANVVVGALRADDWVADRRLAVLISLLSRTRLTAYLCTLLSLGAEQMTLVKRAESVASGSEPSGLRMTPPVRTALDAIGFAVMDRDNHDASF
jgi:hypothetical protein